MASPAISQQRIQRYRNKNFQQTSINNGGQDSQRQLLQQHCPPPPPPGSGVKPVVGNANSKVSADKNSGPGQPKGKVELVASNNVSNARGVPRKAILARKYMLYLESDISTEKNASSAPRNTPHTLLGPTKTPLKCIKLATKDFHQCKVTLRDAKGLNILAAQQRLGRESTEYINPISELIVTPKHLCLISPITYGSLHTYTYSKSGLREGEAKSLFKQMVSIVSFCHSKGVVLRDLKMGRFVFTDKERTTIKYDSLEDAVILPKPDSEDDGLEDRHGCPNYVSPEKAGCVLNNELKYSGKSSDVWALGIALYAMLASRYPFVDGEVSRLLQKICTGSFTMVDGISPTAKNLIRCLLTKVAADRPSCNAILTHPWLQKYGQEYPATIPSSQDFNNRESYRAKRMRLNDDQVVPVSD